MESRSDPNMVSTFIAQRFETGFETRFFQNTKVALASRRVPPQFIAYLSKIRRQFRAGVTIIRLRSYARRTRAFAQHIRRLAPTESLCISNPGR